LMGVDIICRKPNTVSPKVCIKKKRAKIRYAT